MVMRKVPDGIRRVRQGEERPAAWYAIWYVLPDRCVLLGHTRRMPRHLVHRAYPADGRKGQEFRGWVRAVEWLLRTWEQEGPWASSAGSR